MTVNYKPEDGWTADFIPFFWEGEYHLFYLKDFRDVPGHGEGTPWYHLVTRDFVHFDDRGECLPRGTLAEQDLFVFTGSVMYGEGKFHIFYTGHNPHLRQAGKPEQAIMHAVSDDLDHWVKVPEDTFFAPAERFEPHDWRDPFVFFNPQAGEYWMLIAARGKQGPSRRRGCTGLCASRDLKTWQVREPFYAPGLYFTHECPDLFQWGDWWYLVFSEFTDASVTRYRMARSLAGPWITPQVDTFDGHALYAAKTVSDGKERFLVGWNPTRVGEKDGQTWQWGGNLVVHALAQRADGSLAVRIPPAVERFFAAPAPLAFSRAWNTALPAGEKIELAGEGTFQAVLAGELPALCKIEASVVFSDPAKGLGVILRGSEDFESGYYLRIEPQRARLVLDAWPRPGDVPFMVELERPVQVRAGQPVRLVVYLNGSLCEAYLDGQVALSARLYDHPTGRWGFFVQEACAEFSDVRLWTPAE